MLSYIIDTHIVNHYENCVPNAILFFLIGAFCAGSAEYKCSGSLIKSINVSVEGAMSFGIASILFGQPMFIFFSLFMFVLGCKQLLKVGVWVYERYSMEDC